MLRFDKEVACMDSDVKVNMENTIKNAERFFMKRHGHDDVAEMLPPNKGVIATKEISRKYFICVRLCVDIEIMRMEVYPGLYVRDPYYEMTLDYLSKVNNHIRIGCMYIERGGQICASIQTSYKNHAISEQTFYELETRLQFK